MARKMPAQKPGQSKQDVGTPHEFVSAACRKLGIFAFGLDIAATAKNAVARRYFSRREDCFKQPSWKAPGRQWAWLNPEYGDIARYAERACLEAQERGASIAMLVPASVGTNWWRDFVHEKARVLFLNRRITFVGHEDAYPKDLALVLYAPHLVAGYDVWRWK